MAKHTLSEIVALEPEIKKMLTEFLIERPELELKEFEKQTGVTYQVLRRYLYKDKGIRSMTLLRLYNFLQKIRKI